MSTDETTGRGTTAGTAEAPTEAVPTQQPPGPNAGDAGRSKGRGSPLLTVLDVVAPILVFYVCRLFGLDDLTSLLVSAVAPAVSIAYHAIRARRLNGFAMFIGSILLLNIAVALTSADARTLLARDGWITGLAGLFFLFTLWGRRPIVYTLVKPLGEGRLGPEGVSWDDCWDRYAVFRRAFRVLTVLWGIGLIIDAAIRVIFAYTLPVDVVPAANGIQYLIIYATLQAISMIYFNRSALMKHPDFGSFHRKKKKQKKTAATAR